MQIQELNDLLDRYAALKKQPLSESLQRLKRSHSVLEADPAADEVPVTSNPAAGDTATTAPFQDPPPHADWPIIPDYKIMSVLGEGGMGLVFKARHKLTGRVDAIKVIKPKLARDFKLRERFLREAKVLCNLDHANIVRGYTVTEINGQLCLIVEHLDGQNLHDYVQPKGSLPYAEACELLAQVADGLKYAHGHEKQVIHRDIKPNNLMRTPAGQVKILDYGLARCLEGLPTPATQRGGMGTIGYMSPEQSRADGEVDARTDIYSLGATLFYLLAGVREMDTHKLLAELRPDVPAELTAAVYRMIEKDRVKRYQSAGEVATVLRRFAAAPNVAPPPVAASGSVVPTKTWATANQESTNVNASSVAQEGTPPRVRSRRRMMMLGGAAAVCVTLLGIGVVVWMQSGPGDLDKKNDLKNNLVNNPPKKPDPKPVESGEGKKEIKADETPGYLHPLFIKRGQDPVVFEHPAEVTRVAVSPDGKRAVTGCTDGSLHLFDLITGEHKRFPNGPWGDPAKWQKAYLPVTGVVFLSNVEILVCSQMMNTEYNGDVWNLDNLSFKMRPYRENSSKTGHPRWASISDNLKLLMLSRDRGTTVAATLERPNGDVFGECLYNKNPLTMLFGPTMSADGKRVLADHLGKRNVWDTSNPTKPMLEEFLPTSVDGDTLARGTISADGRLGLFSTEKTNNILAWDFAKKEVIGKLQGRGTEITSNNYSLTGNRLITGSRDGTIRVWDLNEMKEIAKFEGHDGFINQVIFTPDGRYGLSVSTDKTLRVWKLSSAKTGTGKPPASEILVTMKNEVSAVALDHEGKFLAIGDECGTVQFRSVLSGEIIATREGEFPFSKDAGPIHHLSIAPGGEQLLVSYKSTRAPQPHYFWVPRTNQYPILGGGQSPTVFALSEDGKRVFAGLFGGQIGVYYFREWTRLAMPMKKGFDWNWPVVGKVADSEELHLPKVFEKNLSPNRILAHLSLSKDAKRVLALYHNGLVPERELRLWDIDDPTKPHFKLSLKDGPLNYNLPGCLSPNGDRFAFTQSDLDRSISIRDWQGPDKDLPPLVGHKGTIMSLVFSPDGKRLLSASKDETVRLWDVATGKEIAKLTDHTDWVTCVAFTPDGKYAISGSKDKTVRKWKLPAAAEPVGEVAFLGLQIVADLRSVTFTADGNTVIAGSRGSIHEWNWRTGQKKQTDDPYCTGAFAVSTDRKKILYGFHTSALVLLDLTSGKARFFKGVKGQFQHAAFSPDGKKVAAVGGGAVIGYFDPEEMTATGTTNPDAGGLGRVDISSATGQLIITRSAFTKAVLWDEKTKQGKQVLNGFPGHALFSPDGSHILAYDSSDKHFSIYDVREFRRKDFLGHTGAIRSLAFSRDGQRAMSGSSDQTVRLWDTQTCQELKRFAHGAAVEAVAFSLDGRYAVSGSNDGTLRVWRLPE